MIRTRLQGDTPFFPNMLNNGNVEVCLKEDVDKVITEKDAEIARLKATPEQIMKEVFDKVLIYPKEMVRLDDAYKLAVALRSTCRALYKACANWARAVDRFEDSPNERWSEMKYKCLAMAEKFK